MNRVADERGQTTMLVLGLALIGFAVVGLAVDGTRAFLLRRTLQNAADAAALAGASELDRDAYYGSGGQQIHLDPEAARRQSIEWLSLRGVRVGADVRAAPAEVRVVLRDEVPTTFLSLVGVDAIPVATEASAEPLSGAP